MRIDSSGNVMIGNTVGASFDAISRTLSVGSGSGNQGITVYSGTASTGSVVFADGTSGTAAYQGIIQYEHTNNELLFYVNYAGNSNPRMRINSSGGVQAANSISVGGATPTTSGAGITFPATQSASSDANTLDDYEEGTWTPTASFSSGTLTSYTSSGIYTKIGNIVVLQAQVTITSGTSGAGAVVISGFPFASGGGSEFGAYGRENANTGKMLNGSLNGTTAVAIYFYDNAFAGANANSLPVTIIYRAA
jgi:hypothetical protein